MGKRANPPSLGASADKKEKGNPPFQPTFAPAQLPATYVSALLGEHIPEKFLTCNWALSSFRLSLGDGLLEQWFSMVSLASITEHQDRRLACLAPER